MGTYVPRRASGTIGKQEDQCAAEADAAADACGGGSDTYSAR